MGSLCQVPKIMYTISYAFNIALLIVIIVKNYMSGFLSVCLLSRMLQNFRLCILLEGFTNFSVNPYDPLSWVMIWRNGQFVASAKNHIRILFPMPLILLC